MVLGSILSLSYLPLTVLSERFAVKSLPLQVAMTKGKSWECGEFRVLILSSCLVHICFPYTVLPDCPQGWWTRQ